MIEKDYDKTEDRCNEMWKEWIETDKNASWGKLLDIVEKIPYCNVPPSISHSDSVKDNFSVVLHDTKALLQELYKKDRYKSSNDDWPRYQPDNYINVALIHHKEKCTKGSIVVSIQKRMHKGEITLDRRCRSERSKDEPNLLDQLHSEPGNFKSFKYTRNFSDIFSLVEMKHDKLKDSYVVLIEGAPGIGKTILSKEITYQWATGNLFKGNLFFMLCLRDSSIQNIGSYSDLAKYITYSHACQHTSSKVEIFARYLEHSQGKEITILLDGYDEYPEKLREESFVADIIRRKVLPLCILIITSRPTASAHLHRSADRRVEILGFTDEDRKQYIKCALHDSPDEIEKVTAYLRQNPFINTLCYIPLNMSILICILKESDSMPKNQTDINYQFICMTIKRHLMREKKMTVDIDSLSKLPNPFNKQLAELSKLAFVLLGKDKAAFSSSDIEECCPKSKFLKDCVNGMGLLQAIEYYNFTNLTEQTSFNFLHFSMQEFLAAFYITSLSTQEQIDQMKDNFWSSKFLNMWVMYVGLTGGNSPALKHFLAGKRYTWMSKLVGMNKITWNEYDDKVKYLYLFHCFLEAGNDQMCQKVAAGNLLEDKTIDLSYTTLLRNNMHTLGFFIVRSATKQWHKLILSKCSIRDTGCEVLSAMISNDRVNFRVLDLSCNQLTPSSLQAIRNLVRHFKLQELKLSDNHLSDIDVSASFFSFALHENGFVLKNPLSVTLKTHLTFSKVVYLIRFNFSKTKFLSDYNLIDKLYVWNTKLQQSDINEIINVTNIKKISVFQSGLRDNECDETLSILKSFDNNDRLAILLLSKTKMIGYNSDIEQLTQVLQKAFTMTVIQLNKCSLTTEALSLIGTVIVTTNNGQWALIDLSDCGIGDGGHKTLFEPIFSKKFVVYVKTLNLSKNTVTDASISTLLESLECCMIKELIVSVDDAAFCNAIAALDFENKVLNWKMKVPLVIKNHLMDEKLKKTFTSLYLINHNIDHQTFESIDNFMHEQKKIAMYGLAILQSNLSTNDLARLISFLHPSYVYVSKCNLLEKETMRLTDVLEKARIPKYVLCTESHLFCHGIDVSEVIKTLQYNSSLNFLQLTHCCIPPSHIYQLGCELATISQHWEKIDFSGCKVEDHGIKLLFDCFSTESQKHLIKVDSLNLSDNSLTNASARKISDFASLLHVRQLIVSHNTLNDYKVANAFASSVKFTTHATSYPSITRIINNDHMTVIFYKRASINEVFESFSHAHCSSVYFVVVNCDIDKHAISEMCICKQKTVSKVCLSDQSMSPSKVKSIFKTLKEIALFNFQVNDEFESQCNSSELTDGFTNDNMLTYSARPMMLRVNKTIHQSVQIVTSNSKDDSETKVHYCKGDCLLANCLRLAEDTKTEATKMTQLALHNVNIDTAMINEINAIAKTNYKLECVALTNNNLHDEGLEKITRSLRNLPLHSITINNATITDKIAEHLAVTITDPKMQSAEADQIYSNIICVRKTTPLLTHLNLSSNFITDKAAEILANVIAKNTVLIHLDLSNCGLQKQGLMNLSQSLQHLPSLRHLALNNNAIPNQVATQLAIAISKIKRLEKIWLRNCKLEENGAMAIFSILKNKKFLKCLDISDNKITERSAKQLSSALSTVGNALTHIKISNCKLMPDYFEEVINSLRFTTSLVCLDVSSNTISVRVVPKLLSIIDQNCKLKILSIANCALQWCENFLMIMEVIEAAKSICHLNISGNVVVGDLAWCLDNFLANNNVLNHLELSDCCIHEEELLAILEKVQNLSHLDLSYNKISDTAANKLAIALKNNVRLEFLNLSHCHLQEVGMNSITHALSSNTSLKSLSLAYHTIEKQAAKNLSYLVMTNVSLHDLNLSHCTFGDEAYDIITNVLQVNQHLTLKIHNCKHELKNIAVSFKNSIPLRDVNLENITIASKTASRIAQTLKSGSTLASLNLGHCNLKTAGILAITDALSKITSLKSLNLSDNVIDHEDGIATANGIANVIVSNVQLEYLNLSGCKLSQTGMIQILRAVKELVKLNHLSLKSNRFNERVANSLADCLKNKKVLQHLNLSEILDSEISIIASSLKSLTTLEYLGLENSSITNEAADLIASIITNNTTLLHLNMSYCILQEEGVIAISKALGKSNRINKLQMNSNSINDVAAGELAKTLSKATSLELLELSDCELEENGLVNIVKSLKNTLLKELDLSSNTVSNKVARCISELCDKVTLRHLNLSHCVMPGDGISMIRDAVQDLTKLEF